MKPATVPAQSLANEGWGPGLGDILDPGDEVSFTYGPETYEVELGAAFSVGPLTARTRVRKGETAAEAYLRVARFVMTAFQAEFALRLGQYRERAAEVKG